MNHYKRLDNHKKELTGVIQQDKVKKDTNLIDFFLLIHQINKRNKKKNLTK